MRIAIPLVEGKLSMHFGHCEEFAIIDVDDTGKNIISKDVLPSPPHEPGLLPRWLAEKGVNVVITGGMGPRAQELFNQNGIRVVLGAPANHPDLVVTEFLEDRLQIGKNICDH